MCYFTMEILTQCFYHFIAQSISRILPEMLAVSLQLHCYFFISIIGRKYFLQITYITLSKIMNRSLEGTDKISLYIAILIQNRI